MDWKKLLPFLAVEIEKGNIWCYDSLGFSRELTKVQEDKIKDLEFEYTGVKILAVIDSSYKFEDIAMHFNTYLMLEDACNPEVCSDDEEDYVVFLAFVDNLDDISCSEMGNVGVIERLGLLRRIY